MKRRSRLSISFVHDILYNARTSGFRNILVKLKGGKNNGLVVSYWMDNVVCFCGGCITREVNESGGSKNIKKVKKLLSQYSEKNDKEITK